MASFGDDLVHELIEGDAGGLLRTLESTPGDRPLTVGEIERGVACTTARNEQRDEPPNADAYDED